MVAHDDQLPQPPMELRQEHRHRRPSVEQAFRDPGGIRGMTQGDGIEEGPRRAWDRLRHRLRDIVAGGDAAGAQERQLLELAVGQLGLPPPIDVAFPDERADPLRQQASGPRAEGQPELAGALA